MPGAWYYLDGAYCVVKTTVVRIYGSQQWCPDCPTAIRSYNIHEWNRLFPGYYCPPGSHCGQPPQTGTQPPAAPPASGGSVVSSGAKGVTSGVAGPGEPGKVYTGPKPAPSEPGCAPAMAVVDEELAHGRFSGDGKTGVGNGGFGFSGVDQLAQPLVVGMTPMTVQDDDGRPTYTQEPRFDLRDELGHQTVHAFHEGTADGILCFHPPELIDYMLHGSGTNPNSRWPTNLSQATILLHNCSRADASTGDVSITRLAFGNPLKGSVLPKSGQYFQYTASTGILKLSGTDANGTDGYKVGHLRIDVALDIPQYSDADQAALVSHRAGTIVWNTTDEEYQYWDGSAWQSLASGGAGDVTAASNITNNALVAGDGGAKGVKGISITVSDTGGDGIFKNLSGVGTLACGAITSTGSISRNGLIDDKGQARVWLDAGGVQVIGAATWTKVQFDSETFDVDGYFDNATNYRYTPTKAGKYTVRARLVTDIDALEWTADPSGRAHGIAVYKNGSAVAYGNVGADHNGKTAMMVFDEVDMNGSTDYIEIFVYSKPGCNLTGASYESYASFERVD